MELPEARGADQNSPVVGVHSGGRRRCRGWTVCNGIAAEMGCSENQQGKCSEPEEAPHLQPPKNSSTSLSPWNRYKTTEGVSIESTRTRNWYMGLIRVGSNRIVFFYPSMVFMIRQISTAKSQCPSPMVVDIDFGMSHT